MCRKERQICYILYSAVFFLKKIGKNLTVELYFGMFFSKRRIRGLLFSRNLLLIYSFSNLIWENSRLNIKLLLDDKKE
jgi:hypothetical protein